MHVIHVGAFVGEMGVQSYQCKMPKAEGVHAGEEELGRGRLRDFDPEVQLLQSRECAESMTQCAEGGEGARDMKGMYRWKSRECDIYAGMRRVVSPVEFIEVEFDKVG